MKRMNKLHEARAIVSSSVRSALVQIRRLELHAYDSKHVENQLQELEDKCTEICTRLDFLIGIHARKEKQKRLNFEQRLTDNSPIDANNEIIKRQTRGVK